MTNLVMLIIISGLLKISQIAVNTEGVIINNRKPLKSMVFCNYQVSPSISKFTLSGRNDPLLCQNFPLKLTCSYE